jgi:hypothetical protein
VIYGETTGDGKADFSILVLGNHHFDTSVSLVNSYNGDFGGLALA